VRRRSPPATPTRRSSGQLGVRREGSNLDGLAQEGEARSGRGGHWHGDESLQPLEPGEDAAADGGQERPLGGQRLADDPFRRAVAACGDDLGRPAPGSGVALGERRALGQDLPDEPGEEVLLHLANDPLDPLHFVLARYGRHARGRVPSIAAVSTQSGA
jgi:hypothetical protein